MSAGRIESVRIRGFRSLVDVELSNLQNANVLIGANGSGKSNWSSFSGRGEKSAGLGCRIGVRVPIRGTWFW